MLPQEKEGRVLNLVSFWLKLGRNILKRYARRYFQKQTKHILESFHFLFVCRLWQTCIALLIFSSASLCKIIQTGELVVLVSLPAHLAKSCCSTLSREGWKRSPYWADRRQSRSCWNTLVVVCFKYETSNFISWLVISQLALTVTMLVIFIYINVHPFLRSCFMLVLLTALWNPSLLRDCSVSSQKYEKKVFI